MEKVLKSFKSLKEPILCTMLQCETEESVIEKIEKANMLGTDAFGLQVENLNLEYHTPKTYKKLFSCMQGKPCYATCYRFGKNVGKSDLELAKELLILAKSGATLVDVMGDLFSKHPEELTDNVKAIEKQIELIDKLHALGAQVLISSHLYKFAPPKRVLEIALEQKRRGADIIKIVTAANNEEEQEINLETTKLLKKELNLPFVFLSNGECFIHRRRGIELGASMCLCALEYDKLATKAQPLLSEMILVKNKITNKGENL
ncbi:MAG: type I 3-dehydroquinate dehydratase [Ruminococcaceae bacterium]|nr:type I 3-dehydroquinate dehydratase [Oscillospiraceae bacterium]